ncbi:unnamed protein product, partial [Prorocentrum cordatum]
VLAEGGRWVLYGLMGGASVDGPVLEALLRKRIRLEATTLRSRSLAYRVDITQRFVKYTTDNDRFSWQDYGVVLDSSRFRLDEAALAHERMEGNKNIGKIMPRLPRAIRRAPPRGSLRSDRSESLPIPAG